MCATIIICNFCECDNITGIVIYLKILHYIMIPTSDHNSFRTSQYQTVLKKKPPTSCTDRILG